MIKSFGGIPTKQFIFYIDSQDSIKELKIDTGQINTVFEAHQGDSDYSESVSVLKEFPETGENKIGLIETFQGKKDSWASLSIYQKRGEFLVSLNASARIYNCQGILKDANFPEVEFLSNGNFLKIDQNSSKLEQLGLKASLNLIKEHNLPSEAKGFCVVNRKGNERILVLHEDNSIREYSIDSEEEIKEISCFSPKFEVKSIKYDCYRDMIIMERSFYNSTKLYYCRFDDKTGEIFPLKFEGCGLYTMGCWSLLGKEHLAVQDVASKNLFIFENY